MTQEEYDQKRSNHEHLTVTCTQCGHQHVVELNCGDRTCPVCRKKWYGYHYKVLKEYIDQWNRPRVMELTLKNVPDGQFSKNTINRLRKCFSRLLHRKYYKARIYGGFYFIHITNRGNGWHPHLHIVYDGKYIPKGTLKKDWEKITGDSYVVWIRPMRSSSKALQYLLADLLKEPRIRPEDHFQYNEVLKSSRIVQGFGKYAKVKIKREFICPVCGNDSWICEDIELRRFHKEFDTS